MLLNNKLKKELKNQGREQAIDGILRSQFSEIEMNGGDRALDLLRDPKERKKATKKIKRDSQRNSPYSTSTNLRIEKIKNSPITMIISATLPLAAALMFFVLYQIYTQPDPIAGAPKITYTGKSINITRNGKSLSALLDMEILNQDTITIPFGKKVNITYDDGSSLELLSNSTITFGNPSSQDNNIHLEQKMIHLNHGEIHVSVSRQPKEFPMLLNTLKAHVKVLGTKFKLSNNKKQTVIQMEKGLVEFHNIQLNKSINVKDREIAIATHNSIAIKDTKVKIDANTKPRIIKDCLVSYHFDQNHFENNSFQNIYPADKNIQLNLNSSAKPFILKSGGLNIDAKISLSNTDNAKEILNQIQESNELSLELWLKPAIINNENNHSMLIAASKDKELFGQPHWLFFLGQENNDLVLSINTNLKENFDNRLVFKNIFSDTSKVHIIITKNKMGLVSLYKNGTLQESIQSKGDLGSWFEKRDKVHLNMTGNNTKSHTWNGILYLSAIYNRALNSAEVQINFKSK